VQKLYNLAQNRDSWIRRINEVYQQELMVHNDDDYYYNREAIVT